jgi:4-amino-4-deoxy-L-arabinose transferase-like glycosyltransferase
VTADPPANPAPTTPKPAWAGDTALLIYIATATVLVHILIGAQYGFHRDELATLDDARRLAWGYIAYPPVTPFFGRISLILFGTSLAGFRFFAALAQAIAVVLTGLMARELGGRRGAQLIAAAAALPFCMAAGALMQYVSFDYLFWVLTAYFVVRLLVTEDPRWLLAIGASIGFGMLSKYTMAFFVVGIVLGLAATPNRRYFKSRWLWIGAAISIFIFLPNLVWQVQHHFVSLDFLKHIHARDIREGRTQGFLPGQIKVTLFALPIWAAGLYYCLFSSAGRRWRMLGWMYIVPLALFVIGKGRDYYMGPAYPMMYAAGAVWGEQWLKSVRRSVALGVRVLAWAALLFDAVLVTVIAMPAAPVNSARWKFAVSQNGDLLEELGWPELVQAVAQVRDALPESDRAHVGILVGDYGEAGAVDLYGPQYGLPPAISGINSFWAHGYGNPPPETLIVLGLSKRFLDRNFASCQVVAQSPNPYHIENEQVRDHPDIYVCRGLRQSWPEFWRDFQYYG